MNADADPPRDGAPPREGARAGRRSIRIDEHERGAYSSDRTRRGEVLSDETRDRPAAVRRARGRRLAPSNRISYAPGSLVVLAGAAGAGQEQFADRLFDKGAVAILSVAKVRAMIARTAVQADAQEQALTVLGRVALARLQSGQAVVVVSRALEPTERAGLVRLAQTAGRPAHLIFLEATLEQLQAGGASEQELELDMPAATELRRAVERNSLGEEGFATVLTLTPRAADGVRQIGFDLDLRSPIE